MPFGGWAERQPENQDEQWFVELKNDNPRTLEVLFRIVHGRWGDLLEKSPPVDLLYDVVIAADYYDMIRALAPWVKVWKLPESMNTWNKCFDNPEDDKGEELAQRIYIAWELGLSDVYEESLFILLFFVSCIDHKTKRLVTVDGVELEDRERLGPPDLIGALHFISLPCKTRKDRALS